MSRSSGGFSQSPENRPRMSLTKGFAHGSRLSLDSEDHYSEDQSCTPQQAEIDEVDSLDSLTRVQSATADYNTPSKTPRTQIGPEERPRTGLSLPCIPEDIHFDPPDSQNDSFGSLTHPRSPDEQGCGDVDVDRHNKAPLDRQQSSLTTTKESNKDTIFRREEQIRLLYKINGRLREFCRGWKAYQSNSPGGTISKEKLAERWLGLVSDVDSCCRELANHRSLHLPGAAWHNRNGIHADLPLSWFNHQIRLLDPARLTSLNEAALSKATRSVQTLEILLDEADDRYGSKAPFSRRELTTLLAKAGIDLKWRRKLGSIDVVKY